MVALDEHTVTIVRTTGLKDRVTRDRIVKAPSLRTELPGLTPSEADSPADSETEPTPTTAIDVEAATDFPVGFATNPRKVPLDPDTSGNSPPTRPDSENRDPTRNEAEDRTTTRNATVARPSRPKTGTRNAGGAAASGLMDALRGDSPARIISQVKPKPANVGEGTVSRKERPLPRRLSRVEPPHSHDTRNMSTRLTTLRPRRVIDAPNGDMTFDERASTEGAKSRDTWDCAPGKIKKKTSPAVAAASGVIKASALCPIETPSGTEDTAWGPVAKLASMCTFGQPLRISPRRALPPTFAEDAASQPASNAPSEATNRPPSTDEDPKTYVVEALTGHRTGTDGMPLFRVRWYGYAREDDTWEPANYIDYNTVVRYCNRTRLPPPNIELWSAPESVGVDN